jgi:hypothetical protein
VQKIRLKKIVSKVGITRLAYRPARNPSEPFDLMIGSSIVKGEEPKIFPPTTSLALGNGFLRWFLPGKRVSLIKPFAP